VIALCVAGSFELFASASAALGGSHAASLGGSRHARLIAPQPHGSRAPGEAGKSPDASSPSPGSPGAPGPAASSRRRVFGRSVTAVGDSVMVAATPALRKALPGIYIDAVVGRQFSAGLQVIAALKARGLLRHIREGSRAGQARA
jgi:hypothetical protein